MSTKELIGLATIILTFIGYVPYYRDTLLGKTKPHAFTWLIWSVLVFIAFLAQWLDGAGAGAWVTAATALGCFGIFLLAILGRGETAIARSDWISFALAWLAMLLWWLTNEPLLAVGLVILIDALATYPTFRKSWHKPYEETLSTHVISTLKFVIALFALESMGLVSWVYPVFLVLANGAVSLMLIIRRRVVSKHA